MPLVLGAEDKYRGWLGEEEAGKGLLLDTDPISLAGHLTGLRFSPEKEQSFLEVGLLGVPTRGFLEPGPQGERACWAQHSGSAGRRDSSPCRHVVPNGKQPLCAWLWLPIYKFRLGWLLFFTYTLRDTSVTALVLNIGAFCLTYQYSKGYSSICE